MVRTVQIGDVLRLTQVRVSQESGAPERIRTFDPQLRKLVLYPLSYERARKQMVPDDGHGLVPEIRPVQVQNWRKTLLHPAKIPIQPMGR